MIFLTAGTAYYYAVQLLLTSELVYIIHLGWFLRHGVTWADRQCLDIIYISGMIC